MSYADDKTQFQQFTLTSGVPDQQLRTAVSKEYSTGQLSTQALSWIHAGAALLYAVSGAAMMSVSIILGRTVQQTSIPNSTVAALILALKPINLNVGLFAGVVVASGAVLTVLGTIARSRAVLKTSFLVTVLSILLTLAFGLSVWFRTMIERREYFILWQNQSANSTMLLQDRFKCCGYFDSNNPPFLPSKVCSSAATAAAQQGCFLAFTAFADTLLSIFTTVFGMSGAAFIALLTGLILTKRLSEKERFQRIDQKRGTIY